MSLASLARDLAGAIDPAATARAFGIEPEPWQARLLRSRARLLLACTCRQIGKSTMASLLGVHTAVYDPGALTVVISPSQRQSDETLAKMRAVYRGLGRPVPLEAENASEMRLENGSRLLSLPGTESTVRGFSAARLLILDEAARIEDTVFTAVMPMVAADGRVVALTTPGARAGWCWEAWSGERPGWERIKITAHESAQYPPARIEALRAALGDRQFRAELLAEWTGVSDSAFSPDDVERAFDNVVPPLRFGGLR